MGQVLLATDDGWLPVGVTGDGWQYSIAATEHDTYETFTSYGTEGWTATFDLGPVTPRTMWLLFRRTHPRIRRMHELYRRRHR